MSDRNATRLLFSPYRPPRYKPDRVLRCEVRSRVVVCGMSDARIPWPVGTSDGRPRRGRDTAPDGVRWFAKTTIHRRGRFDGRAGALLLVEPIIQGGC